MKAEWPEFGCRNPEIAALDGGKSLRGLDKSDSILYIGRKNVGDDYNPA
jgi:hypothetical protein